MERSIEGNLVDVVNGKIFPARVRFSDGKVTKIDTLDEAPGVYILPGFIDAHIHIESSQLCPSRFAEEAVAHGTTSVVCDPHEIANVLGMEGVMYMVEDAKGVPLRIYFTAPSCVPATKFETSGSRLGVDEVEKLLAMKEFVGLGEVMDYKGVLAKEPELLGKIKAAKFFWKQVDGHCPGLTGRELVDYIGAGITSDHECITSDEAEEKFHMGMWIMAREGSGHKNLRALLPFVKSNECFLVSDDLQAVDLAEGHLDMLLRKAVLMGVDPMHAIRAVTAWPSWHYFLPSGVIGPGKNADIVVVQDLRLFKVLEVYIGGELVARDGKALFEARPRKMDRRTRELSIRPEDLAIRCEGRWAEVRVIKAEKNEIESSGTIRKVPVIDGRINADLDQDVLHLAVVNRYMDAPPALGFVTGFRLRRGAAASTVSHDSHNIIAVGAELGSMAKAINMASSYGGYHVVDGDKATSLVLDIAGLMSTAPCSKVIEDERRTIEALREMGCDLPSPFATLSFLSLLVVPELKLSDKGLFDTRSQRFVDVVVKVEK
ncbi:MAG: adenine deaminase [Methanomassiliicoccales archaeon]|nr:MAG: adenine deaminase [Methanomassiliicoccales archaeon]